MRDAKNIVLIQRDVKKFFLTCGHFLLLQQKIFLKFAQFLKMEFQALVTNHLNVLRRIDYFTMLGIYSHTFWAETLVAYITGDRFSCCNTHCAAIFSTKVHHNASFSFSETQTINHQYPITLI